MLDKAEYTVADLFATADDALFKRMLANQHDVLQPLLPDQSSHNYNLRNRRHQLQLTQKQHTSIINFLSLDSLKTLIRKQLLSICYLSVTTGFYTLEYRS